MVLFSIDFFVCIFLSLLARLRENGWTNLHEIFREGVEWPWDDLITFLNNSEKPRDAAMRNTGVGFVVLYYYYYYYYYPPCNVQRCAQYQILWQRKITTFSGDTVHKLHLAATGQLAYCSQQLTTITSNSMDKAVTNFCYIFAKFVTKLQLNKENCILVHKKQEVARSCRKAITSSTVLQGGPKRTILTNDIFMNCWNEKELKHFQKLQLEPS